MIRANDLATLGQAKLAELLAEQLATLPYHRQKEWARHHIPSSGAGPSSRARPSTLLREIEDFCSESRSGAFVSWVDDHGWYEEDDPGDDGEAFQDWIEIFSDLIRRACALTRSGQHADAVKAFDMLLGLLKEAGETTDILGNHGAPEDSVSVRFADVIEAYTRSLTATRSDLDEAINDILPTARRFRYAGGFAGLARGLDAQGRKRLQTRLAGAVEAALKTDRRECPAEVDGLVELARLRKDQAGVIALKERFASRNAVYLKEALSHYERKKDWRAVARLAEAGVRHFGSHGEFAKALVKAREALGDRSAAQEARIAHFLGEPSAAEFAALRRRSEALSNWDAIFERLLRASASAQPGSWHAGGLRTRLLLAEGREREVLDGAAGRTRRMGVDEIKLVAKLAVARLSAGVNLASFRKLRELQARLKREKEDPYDWLRLCLERPATLTRAEYAHLAAEMYRRLVDFHLDSGKSSRASPAAHYCAIVAEVSRLVDQPDLWADLLRHLRRRHGRKRLIWERLRAEGCLLS